MLKEKIDQELVKALKAKNEEKTSVLRMLKSAIQNMEIQQKKALEDTDVLSIVQSQIKSRRDSIEMYRRGSREELAQKEEREIEILKVYLPEQLPEEEIRLVIKKAITSVGASSIQDMGKVMGEVMPELKGKADGALISQITKEELQNK